MDTRCGAVAEERNTSCSGVRMENPAAVVRLRGWESAIAVLERGARGHDRSRMQAAFGRRIRMILELLSGPWSSVARRYLLMVN